jgi:hypothetical protein
LYPAAFCSTRNGIPSCFSSAAWFGTEFRQFVSIFVPRNGIPSCFLFRGRVRNRIPRVCFYFCSTERNSELFSLPWKVSERNSERFLFRGTAGITSEMIICSVYSVFRGIIFCRKFLTLLLTCLESPRTPVIPSIYECVSTAKNLPMQFRLGRASNGASLFHNPFALVFQSSPVLGRERAWR